MHPEAGEFLPRGGFALGDLIFVMRENKILPSPMDVERKAEVFPGHGGAFQMPSRPSLSPGAFPERLPRLGGFPQGKVQRVFLGFTHGDASPGAHFIDIPAGQLPVLPEGTHPEINIPACNGIGMPLLNQGSYHLLHLPYVRRRPRLDVGPQDIELVHVLVEGVDVGLGDVLARSALPVRPGDDLVVNVGEIPDEGHLQPPVAQIAHKHVENDGRAGMADMAQIVCGYAAGVYAGLAGRERDEFFLPAGHRIVQLHPGHSFESPA